MNGKGGNATVLQLLCQVHDNLVAGIPTETGLYGDRYFYGIHYGAGYFEHFGNVLQHSGSCPFAGYTLHRTSEVDVQNIRMCLFYNSCSFHHRVRIFTVYLYGYGTLLVTDFQLLFGLTDGTYQCVA